MKMRRKSRWDHDAIYEIIPERATVLDLGCGDGELLARLIKNKLVLGLGVEKDIDQVAQSIAREVPVVNLDLDEGITGFPDKYFDFVVLEKTLQVVNKPIFVLNEMLRVGGAGIISFPNFGHRLVVEYLASTGRMPITPVLPYQWYDTPNIHLFTVRNFLDWVGVNNVRVIQGLSLIDGKATPFREEDDARAEEVLLVVSTGLS
ncbi:MAG: methionine biosynthesis protein MetW [Eubacteriales bacterium]|jgi:methionine biosynthesis protein MetW